MFLRKLPLPALNLGDGGYAFIFVCRGEAVDEHSGVSVDFVLFVRKAGVLEIFRQGFLDPRGRDSYLPGGVGGFIPGGDFVEMSVLFVWAIAAGEEEK